MCVKTNQEDQNPSPKPSKPSTNPPQAEAGWVTASGPPQGQGQHPVAPSETQAQADGRAQSQAEDELDEGKRLRPKINTNLVRRETGGIRQKRAPDSVRVESRAPDSVRAESVDLNFDGSDLCFSLDLDRPAGPNPRGRKANLNLNLNQDFWGPNPEFSDQNLELGRSGKALDSGFRLLPGDLSPNFFSFEPSQGRMGSRSESGQLAVSGSGPGYDPDLVPDSQPPLQDKIRSLRLSRASLSHCRISRKRPEERLAGPEGGERVARASSSLERPKPGGGGGERGTGDFGGEIGGERSEFLCSARVLQNCENLTELVLNITRHNQNPERLKKETKKQDTERGSSGPGATSNSRLVARSGSGTTVPKFSRVSSDSKLKLLKSLKPGACTQDTKLTKNTILDPKEVLKQNSLKLRCPNLIPGNRLGKPIILEGWGEVKKINEDPR